MIEPPPTSIRLGIECLSVSMTLFRFRLRTVSQRTSATSVITDSPNRAHAGVNYGNGLTVV